jgi:hypothetical protein
MDVAAVGKALGENGDAQALLSGTGSSPMTLVDYSTTGSNDNNTSGQPLTLDWNWNRIETGVAFTFGAPAVQASARTIYAVPRYWTTSIETAHALELAKDKEISASLSTDWEIRRPEQHIKGAPRRQGQSFSMEWGITHLVPLDRRMTKFLEFGAAGYDGWVSRNSAAFPSSLSPTGVPLSVHAAGFQAGFIVPEKNLSFTLKYEPEYKAHNLSRGGIVVIEVSWTW